MKTMIRRLHEVAIILGLVSILVSGCAATNGRQSTGEYIDDAAITTKVKAMMIDNFATQGFSIRVSTYKGTVQLSGYVNTPDQKRRATTVASKVYGVKKVINNIIVRSR